jgi:hypothetical protein
MTTLDMDKEGEVVDQKEYRSGDRAVAVLDNDGTGHPVRVCLCARF